MEKRLVLVLRVPGLLAVVPCASKTSGWRVLQGEEAVSWVDALPFRAFNRITGNALQGTSTWLYVGYSLTPRHRRLGEGVGEVWRDDGSFDVGFMQAISQRSQVFFAPLCFPDFKHFLDEDAARERDSMRIEWTTDVSALVTVPECVKALESFSGLRICAIPQGAEPPQPADIESGACPVPELLTMQHITEGARIEFACNARA